MNPALPKGWGRERRKGGVKKRAKLIIFFILAITGLLALKFITARPVSRPGFSAIKGVQKTVVKAAPVKREDLSLILSYAASLKAKDEVNVFSKVTGKLAQYLLNEGDSIEKGQVLALVDRDETGLKYELAKIESPISGIVGRTLLDKGANVIPAVGINSGTPLAVIVHMQEMSVRLYAPEQDIPYLKKGLKAKIQVDAYPEDSFEGEVSKVSEVVDSETRPLPIEITIPNKNHRLKSGLFCRVEIIALEHKDVLALKQDAVVREQNENYVFVAEDHTARKRRVTLGLRDDSRIEVLEGLKESEMVIVFGQQGLKDGATVEIKEE